MSNTLENIPAFRFFEDAVTRLMNEPRTNRPWSPAVDIFETEDLLTLRADLPDVKLEDIAVRIENQTLTISGHRAFERDEKLKGYHRIERSYGDFVRSFAVPSNFDGDSVAADYANGALTVTLPRKQSARARQVKVSVHDGNVSKQ